MYFRLSAQRDVTAAKLGMWTEQSRGRMAEISRKTRCYPSDLTDEKWVQIEPWMPKPGFLDFTIEIIRRCDKDPRFKVLPRRWVAGRSFGWLTRWRRLVRDCEQRLDVSEAMILMVMSSLLLRRNAQP